MEYRASGNSLLTFAIKQMKANPYPGLPESTAVSPESRRHGAVEAVLTELQTNPIALRCAAHLIVDHAIQHIDTHACDG